MQWARFDPKPSQVGEKDKKKKKEEEKSEKKIVFGAGSHDPQITDSALNPLG